MANALFGRLADRDAMLQRTDPAAEAIVRERLRLTNYWSEAPWNFLTGSDPTSFDVAGVPDTHFDALHPRPLIWTKDESDELHPYKPFPATPYLQRVLYQLFNYKVVICHKSRQMLASTLFCLTLLWLVIFRTGRRCLVSKQTEELAIELIADKIRSPYSRLPDWFKREHPISMTPANRIDVAATESVIYAVTQNAAVGALRGGSASVCFIDEAAFQEYFQDMVQAAEPMAARVWAVTTPNVGNAGAKHCHELIEEDAVVSQAAAEQLGAADPNLPDASIPHSNESAHHGQEPARP